MPYITYLISLTVESCLHIIILLCSCIRSCIGILAFVTLRCVTHAQYCETTQVLIATYSSCITLSTLWCCGWQSVIAQCDNVMSCRESEGIQICTRKRLGIQEIHPEGFSV